MSSSVALLTFVAMASTACVPHSAPTEKQAIESLIIRFNSAVGVNDFDGLVALFTKDADFVNGTAAPIPAAGAIRQLPPKRLPWDERTALTMKIDKITFTSAHKATVEAIQSDYAPIVGMSRKWSCQFVVVRTDQTWRIASYREFALLEKSQ